MAIFFKYFELNAAHDKEKHIYSWTTYNTYLEINEFHTLDDLFVVTADIFGGCVSNMVDSVSTSSLWSSLLLRPPSCLHRCLLG